MNKLTVCVTCLSDEDRLKVTLESLCEQTDEDFDVLLLLTTDDGGVRATALDYCGEYRGFSMLEIPGANIPASRNAALRELSTELVLFMLEGDYLAPEFVEKIFEAAENVKADVYLPRLYLSGENEPAYKPEADLLATVPKIDRFDSALLRTLDDPGKVYRRKLFDLYSLTWPEDPAFYEMWMVVQCVYRCDARLTGVAGAIYDDKNGSFTTGFLRTGEPNEKTLSICISRFNELVTILKDLLTESAGRFDGDEYTIQDALSVYFQTLTDRFYRRFWYLTDEDLTTLRDSFEAIAERLTKERYQKLCEKARDLRFPAMYMRREDAARLPIASLLIDFAGTEGLSDFLSSLYRNRFPFFEVYLRESQREAIPERWRDAENLQVLPDENFFAAARAEATGLTINVKDADPLDPKLLSELFSSKARPRGLYPYAFAAMRKKTKAKTYLKKKGMDMR